MYPCHIWSGQPNINNKTVWFNKSSLKMSLSLFKKPHLISRILFLQTRTCKCKPKGVIIPNDEVKRFVKECAIAAGANEENACQLATILVAADEKGYYTHGINRLGSHNAINAWKQVKTRFTLGLYIGDMKKCLVDGKAKPKIEKETPATAWVDGKDALGAVVGHFCMALAIKKAKECGVGWIVANRIFFLFCIKLFSFFLWRCCFRLVPLWNCQRIYYSND